LAFEILRRADAAPAIDEDVAVSKDARGKYRQCDEWTIAAAHQADEFGRRQLRHVELPPSHHAVENLASRRQRDAIEGEPRGDHIPLADRVHPIVTAAGKGQGKTRHGARSLTRRRPVIHIGGRAHVDAVDGAIATDAIPPPGRGQPTPVISCFLDEFWPCNYSALCYTKYTTARRFR